MKDKSKILDEQLTTLLTDKDIKNIQEKLGFEFHGEAFDNETGLISLDFMRELMIKRDEIVYKLTDIKREDGLSYSDIKNEVEVNPEETTFNSDLQHSDNITVTHAEGEGGRQQTFYYYGNNTSENNMMTRQMRTQYEDGTISRIERVNCFSSNNQYIYVGGGIGYLDGSLLLSMKNDNGKKQASLYRDDIIGYKYFEYDKDGNNIVIVNEADMDKANMKKMVKWLEGFLEKIKNPKLENKENGMELD